MIDWITAECYAIAAGARGTDMIQGSEARKLLVDLDNGLTGWNPRATASMDIWSEYGRGVRVLGIDHCRVNGLSKVTARENKRLMLEKNRETMRRLMDSEDLCLDLVDDGLGNKLIDEDELAQRLVKKYSLGDRFKTNWTGINDMLTNFSNGDVLLLSGLSGTGKTNVAVQMSYFAGYKTLYYGVDMSVSSFADRLAKIQWYRDNNGLSSEFLRDECDMAVERLAKESKIKYAEGIKVYDCESMTLEQIEHSARSKMESFKAQVLIIDYAGRIESAKTVATDQWRQDAEIARAIKGMAKRLDIRVIALSQFSGKAEQYKKPDRSWMSGSKELISASDVIMAIWQDSRADQNGKVEGDPTHIWISDDIKNRDSGTHGNTRLETYGLWLSEDF
jgi:replicative DNA helicase